MTQRIPLRTLDGQPIGGFAFGTMQYGGRADRAASDAMYADCRAAGLRHFDTAFVYTDGASEEILGAQVKAEREAVFVASKVGYIGGAGAENLQTQFETSRRRLNMDVVDLLYLHRFDPNTDLRETLHWFAEVKAKSQIRHVGLSNFAAWQVMKAIQIAAEFDLSVDVLQPMYSLVKRQAEVEILPMCADQDILAATYSPLGGGLLTGKYNHGGQGRLSEDKRYAARYGQPWMHTCGAQLAELAERHMVDPATLAVAWAAAHSCAPCPILSARSSAQLAPSLAALSYDLSDALYAEIETLSPRPAPATDRLEES
ncbi:General stress protein 69 [Tritonibacter multivorans]|uniref:General stress protein 69 n=1 Tax=Tritonibacter multivorans TaxID=928856 RepID=A0A0P1GH12_9RHOB|nr:aldo/keto reductase [Tritonibacter multivorans]MDA7422435.1 aldo/keto reductase [Tritonibacter multivorans]CUH74947.1 General stress protein 69 [Tritonibacter multivorans]SFD44083.1 Predicted oxidoreductase [Tritonibacter multivorans]